jgi:hypothetical protein
MNEPCPLTLLNMRPREVKGLVQGHTLKKHKTLKNKRVAIFQYD